MDYYIQPSKKLPVLNYDVVVAGAGTGGVFAAIAAARNGAKTMVIELKGYPGGIAVEGGTALHSFFNQWRLFEGVEKRQLVKGIPHEMIERLTAIGGCSGHVEVEMGYNVDCVNTSIDTELYKVTAFEMMEEAGVCCMMNTMVVDAIVEDDKIIGVIIENRGGRQVVMAKSFIDATGHGDLSAHAGAKFTEPMDNIHANSMGVGGVDVDKYYDFLMEHNVLNQSAYGMRSGKPERLIRAGRGGYSHYDTDNPHLKHVPKEMADERKEIGMAYAITTLHDDYFMFVKTNCKVDGSSTNMELINAAELEVRKKQVRAINLLRQYIPGCEHAFIARTAPSLLARRSRCIVCDYDIPPEEIQEGKHYHDDVFSYGFHDSSPKVVINNGGSYGVPYRAIIVKEIKNLYAIGMMISSHHESHMSTRNTVCCMGMGQAAGTAAALCVKNKCMSRELSYDLLKKTLIKDDVYLEN